MTTLTDLMTELAHYRERLEKQRHTVEDTQTQLIASPLGILLTHQKADYDLLGSSADALQLRIKKLALTEYVQSGNPKPVVGIQIKMYHKVLYDPVSAAAWVAQNAPALLVPDWKRFEKLGPDLGAPVEIVDDPHVTFASDLSAYLESAVGRPNETRQL